MSDGDDRYASIAEATLALTALTSADHARLGRIAQLRAHGLPGLGWEDLLNDAIERLLSGARRWPKDVPILVFLREVIRSLVSEAWRRHNQAAILTLPGQRAEGEGDLLASLPDPSPDPEQAMLARDLLSHVMAAFRDDPAVQGIIVGMAEGLNGEELRQTLRLSALEYETCRRRLRRGLARHFPEGLAS